MAVKKSEGKGSPGAVAPAAYSGSHRAVVLELDLRSSFVGGDPEGTSSKDVLGKLLNAGWTVVSVTSVAMGVPVGSPKVPGAWLVILKR